LRIMRPSSVSFASTFEIPQGYKKVPLAQFNMGDQ
jgi:hypothetical protein